VPAVWGERELAPHMRNVYVILCNVEKTLYTPRKKHCVEPYAPGELKEHCKKSITGTTVHVHAG